MISDVMIFNMVRGTVDRFDRDLEERMLNEEFCEFLQGALIDDPIDRIAEYVDALVDMEYVFAGSRIKAAKYGVNIDVMREIYNERYNICYEVLLSELKKIGLEKTIDFFNLFDRAKEIVCEINAMKPTKKDSRGKVQKQKDLPEAKEQIKEVLFEMIRKPKRTKLPFE